MSLKDCKYNEKGQVVCKVKEAAAGVTDVQQLEEPCEPADVGSDAVDKGVNAGGEAEVV